MNQKNLWTFFIDGKKVGSCFHFRCEKEIDEILLSYNFLRDQTSHYEIYISFDESKKFLIATLGPGIQKSYRFQEDGWGLNQDIIYFTTPTQVDTFQVEICGLDGGCLPKDSRVYASVSNLKKYTTEEITSFPSIELDSSIQFFQFDSPHPRRGDICSPTSIAHACNLLKKDRLILPHHVAERVYDTGFNIYGNWMFAVAYGFELLFPVYKVVVQRLHSFEAILSQLKKGCPVCVSVKGELPGTIPYQSGHLMTVIGYQNEHVICLDSGNQRVKVCYPIADFLKVWSARQNLAYVFLKNSVNV